MSNSIVGDLYQDIINGVIGEARLDFEDSGVDEATLQELKKIWQEKLVSSGVAKFPWVTDNSPSLATTQVAKPPTPETRKPASSNASTSSSVKKEEDTNGRLPAGGLVLPGGGPIAQTDGALPIIDLSDSRNLDNLTTQDVDRIIAHSAIKERQRFKDANEQIPSQLEIELDIPPHLLRKLRQQQVDGAGDDDSDGINSDLDDPEDDIDSDGEDEEVENSMMMLCLYDKVQRVKNKWKYILKDGVANINGKDYVFNRANVESEW